MAPEADLLAARRAQADWARALCELPDAALLGASEAARLVAAVAMEARRIAWSVEGDPGAGSALSHAPRAATLRPDALRSLAHHAAVHLAVTWRDLDEEGWEATLCDGTPLHRTPGLRAARLIRAAADLRALARQARS